MRITLPPLASNDLSSARPRLIKVRSLDDNKVIREILWWQSEGCPVQGDFSLIARAKVARSGFELNR